MSILDPQLGLGGHTVTDIAHKLANQFPTFLVVRLGDRERLPRLCSGRLPSLVEIVRIRDALPVNQDVSGCLDLSEALRLMRQWRPCSYARVQILEPVRRPIVEYVPQFFLHQRVDNRGLVGQFQDFFAAELARG